MNYSLPSASTGGSVASTPFSFSSIQTPQPRWTPSTPSTVAQFPPSFSFASPSTIQPLTNAPFSSLFTPQSTGAFPNPVTQPLPAPPSLPKLPAHTKFVDLPQHVKDALLNLEKTVKETNHKANSPALRPVMTDSPSEFLSQELAQLHEKMSYYKMYKSKMEKDYEFLKRETEAQFSDFEIAYNCYERLRTPHLRAELSALERPMNNYFKKIANNITSTYTELFSKIKELESYLADFGNGSSQKADVGNKTTLKEVVKLEFESMLKVFGKISALVKDLESLKAEYLEFRRNVLGKSDALFE